MNRSAILHWHRCSACCCDVPVCANYSGAAEIARLLERQGRECPSGMSLPHCFGVMKATVVDTKPPRFQFGVDLDDRCINKDIVPGIVLMIIKWSRNLRLHSACGHK